MFDLLKNIAARLRLGCFMFNDSESDDVNDIFDRFMVLQWVHIEMDSHYIIVTASNNRQLGVWSANRYYGFASKGYVRDINDGNAWPVLYEHYNLFNWDNCRPSAWRMVAFLKRVSAFNKTRMSRELAERREAIPEIVAPVQEVAATVEENEIIKETLGKL